MPRGESSTINMFTAACQQFVKSIGKTTLHATPSLDEKDNVKMFQVVLKSKRRRFIFWEKSVFRPSEFQLTDMMVDRKPLNVKMTTTDLVQEFNRTSKLSLKGKIGAEICKEIIDVELDANDTITLDIKFGSVKKQELGEQDMIDELSDRHINMEHPYVRQIRKDKRNSLCLISGVALLPDGGTIHRVTDEDLEAIAKAAPLKANGSAGVEYVKDRDIRLAKDTAVAYNVQELDIDTNTGAIQLVLTGGKTGGGFRACVGYDEVDAGTGDVSVDFQLDHAREVFAYFLDLDPKTRSEVNKNLLKLMEYPRDVDVIADLLNNIEAGQEVNNSVSDLAKRVVSPREVWQYVLEQAGFSVDDDSLVIPKSKERVSMFGEFFDAATVVEESLLKLLTSLSASNAENMLLVLKSGIQRAPVTVKNIVAEVLSDKTSHKMLEHLKYHLDELGVIAPPAEMPFCIDALYWIVFALYGK
ncbi:gasdermin-E-like [Dreissena polymorpha]|uniref:gasdermin-E-like n=1 Tax=Dreissena polymorpha TaxID=45954 RepID=UPI002263FD71|nr:gasdermin-E-like [Dreissena polymorpha]XP_052234498.1 gasdermin-E-like [Dreissena polymorpha]XP_052234499.1 gasdermin-E-like [Dreissena polymorpha]